MIGRHAKRVKVDRWPCDSSRGAESLVDPSIDWAQKFDSMGELAAEWRRASTMVLIRPDGKPNRAARTGLL